MRCIQLIALAVITAFFAASSSLATEAEELSEIEAILQGKSEAWNQHDAEEWGKNYSADSILINIFGTRFPDRQANIDRHAEILAGIFRNSSMDLEIERIKRLSNDVVLAETLLTVTGYEALPKGVPETSPGVLQTRMTFVLRDDEAKGWQIVFAQNTAIVSP